MAIKDHLDLAAKGADAWNAWRRGTPRSSPDLSFADLSGQSLVLFNLADTNLSGANLADVNLIQANLHRANLQDANLTGANLYGASLVEANLSGAKLIWASLVSANLSDADLSQAMLDGVKLNRAILVGANLEQATLSNCWVYGISAWDLVGTPKSQSDLFIMPSYRKGQITVDDLEVAQFIYLLVQNKKIRNIIDTITSKVVLILGRFTPARKSILDAVRAGLRDRGYVPVLFDFDRSPNLDLTETITLLARMARFIIADLTEPSSIPHELEAIIPTLAVPVQPLLQSGHSPYSMFSDYWKYDWLLKVHEYADRAGLLATLDIAVIAPAEAKAVELFARRNRSIP